MCPPLHSLAAFPGRPTNTRNCDLVVSPLDHEGRPAQVANGAMVPEILAHRATVVVAAHGDDAVGKVPCQFGQLVHEGNRAIDRFLAMILVIAAENQQIAPQCREAVEHFSLEWTHTKHMEIAGENDSIAIECCRPAARRVGKIE